MKRLIVSVFALVLVLTGLLPMIAAAQESDTVELILHKRLYRDVRAPENRFYENNGLAIDEENASKDDTSLISKTSPLNGANFTVYDATELYQTAKARPNFKLKDFVDGYSKLSRKEARAIAKTLTPVAHDPVGRGAGKINTRDDDQLGKGGIGRITVPRKKANVDTAYLIIEDKLDANKDLNVDLEQRSSPLMVVLPAYDPITQAELTEIHLYPKNVGYVRDPYFFKYGSKGSERVPLAGAKFVLFQYADNGEKLYLDMSPVSDLKNNWVKSNDPLRDDQIDIFTSDKNGLVNTGERFLPAGTYYFEEVQSVPGYEISAESKKIKVVIPEDWFDEAGNFQYVTVNGQKMEELVSGKVPENVTSPRVYNYAAKEAPKPDPTPIQPGTPGKPGQSGGTGGTGGSGGAGGIIPLVTQQLSRVLPSVFEDHSGQAKPQATSTPEQSEHKGLLPQTGEAKLTVSLLGVLLVLISLLVLTRRKGLNQG